MVDKWTPKTVSARTNVMMIILVLCLAAIGALNIWLLINFRELRFTEESKKSNSHTVVEALLWTLATVPLIFALIVIGLFIYTGRNGSAKYKVPLVALIISLVIYSALQFVISFFWKNLEVENIHDPRYVDFSNTILLTGYLTLPTVFVILGIWWFFSKEWKVIQLRRAQKELEKVKGEHEVALKKYKEQEGEVEKIGGKVEKRIYGQPKYKKRPESAPSAFKREKLFE